MTRPIIKFHNSTTDEVIEREMNDAEFAQYEVDQAAQTAQTAEQTKAEADKAAAQAKLAALGLSADDLKALGL